MAAMSPSLEVYTSPEPRAFEEPRKRISSEVDIERFPYTKAYLNIMLFITQLNRALCPTKKPDEHKPDVPSVSSSDAPQQQPTSTSVAPSTAMKPPNVLKLSQPRRKPDSSAVETFTIHSERSDPSSVKQLQALLEKLQSFIDEAPPSKEPRRFGNASFRTWHQLLEQRADDLLKEFLPQHVLDFRYDGIVSPIDELRAYFLGSFGSATRLDYGTGHELSFLAFLGCLWQLGAFKDGTGHRSGDIERSIVFGVFEPYLNLMRKLILTYTLEPAGSHGVWGLDDHFFLPYIFGSAQLTRPVAPDEAAMPLEGSVRGAPEPADVVKPDRVERLRAENMYFSAIGFIYDVKSGPFWEHSPVLYNVSGIKDGWGKINKGMIKMFAAEVLGKFPVVQHFPFGSLFPWEMLPDAPAPATAKPVAGGDGIPVSPVTKAPGGGAPGYVTQRPRGNMPAPGAVPTRLSSVHGNGVRELNAARRPGGDTTRQPGNGYSISRSGDPYLHQNIPRDVPGTASAQVAITKAPWNDVG